MKLSEVFYHLSYGELSQLGLGGLAYEETPEANYPKLISHINLGLTSLYKRFFLKEGQLEFELSSEGNVYDLQRDDIHKIERILTAEGYELGLNDESDVYSCITPSLQSVRVPWAIVLRDVQLPDALKTSALQVVYRANHPIITDVSDPESYLLELPYSHMEALLYFIASRVHNPIGMINEFHSGNSYYAKYEAECQRLEQQNIQVDRGQQSTRLERNGWM